MDGRGAWRDNVFVERLWKSVKYERAYLHAYDTLSDARMSIMEYMDWFNQKRPHSRLGKKTPGESYVERMTLVRRQCEKPKIPLKKRASVFKQSEPLLF